MSVWMFPGQGSQAKGMGLDLFAQFPAETRLAEDILGWSLTDLCRRDADGLLGRTDYTQPALFVVSALEVLRRRQQGDLPPAYVAGHSLGEYAALFAADVFDFETGVKLVKKRGALMNAAQDGAMLAVLGMEGPELVRFLKDLTDVQGPLQLDVANYNAPTQTVLSGASEDITKAATALSEQDQMAIPLNVSAAFHSRLMKDAAAEFSHFLNGFSFRAPTCPVIANVTARPYAGGTVDGAVRQALTAQITGSVRWLETVQYLLAKGEDRFEEVGPGQVLTKLLGQIRKAPLPDDATTGDIVPLLRSATPPSADISALPSRAPVADIGPGGTLGSAAFKQAHGLDYAYYAGAMYKGIASPQMVMALRSAGMLGILGTGGVDLGTVAGQIDTIRSGGTRTGWGINLLSNPDHPEYELALVDLALAKDVTLIEASAFIRLTPAILKFRFSGARRAADGTPEARRRIIAKISRPEVAEAFMRAAPDALIADAIAAGHLTEEEGWCAARLPIADDISVEADSGGHTDQRSAYALVPAIRRLRDRLARETGFDHIRIGAGGGIGTPEAIVAALVLGADYVFTGSINQCTPEAATSDAVKDILQGLGVADFTYAPAGDMFELGARVQVAKRGLFFAARANRLFDLYRQYDALEDLPADTRRQLEERYFRRPLESIWQDVYGWLKTEEPDRAARAMESPKYRMAQVFRWYFHHTTELALSGDPDGRVDYQIHSGPALGAFNEWAKDGPFAGWRNRPVAAIGRALMDEAAELLNEKMTILLGDAQYDHRHRTGDAVR